MTEVVVFHDLAEVNVNNEKVLVWVGTQTFSIKYLDDEGNGSDSLVKNSGDLESQIQMTAIDRRGLTAESNEIMSAGNAYAHQREIKTEDGMANDSLQTLNSYSSSNEASDGNSSTSNSPKAGVNPLICEICNREFSTAYVRKRHQMTHLNVKPYLCDLCKKRFTQSSSYYSHKCLMNPFGTNLAPVVTQVKSNKLKLISCPHCKKTFQGMYMLNRHMTLHTGEKPYRCDKCNRSFTQWTGRHRHKCITKFVHKTYSCDLCDKVFKDESFLALHLRTQHSTDPVSFNEYIQC